ncbi:MAG: tryptophan synthase subunit alpha [Thermovirgaceae bacterium]
MTDRLQSAFSGRKALIPYVTAGDPSLDVTGELVKVLASSGADIIEIGVPFSDPQADGPVIQASSERALERGATLGKVLEVVRRLSGEVDVPLVLMGYFNPVLRYGPGRFAPEAAEAGVAGVIIPDLPFDEDPDFYRLLGSKGVQGVYMVAPNTAASRLEALGRQASGFVYCVSLYGTTGNARGPVDHLGAYLETVRKYVNVPLVVGFGIDGPDKAADAAGHADGVVVGSALVRIIERYGSDTKRLKQETGSFMMSLREAMDRSVAACGRG